MTVFILIMNQTDFRLIRNQKENFHYDRIPVMEFLKTSDCTDESRKDETCLQFKMKKHYIKT